MNYVILVWVSVSIGFVMGAAWSGLCRKNKHFEQGYEYELKDLYSSAERGEL